jgi:hypothetical protein
VALIFFWYVCSSISVALLRLEGSVWQNLRSSRSVYFLNFVKWNKRPATATAANATAAIAIVVGKGSWS